MTVTTAHAMGWAAGDREEARKLYERLAPSLELWARQRNSTTLGIRPEDLVQDVWIELANHPQGFDRERGTFRAWVFGIAKNVLLRAYQGQGRLPREGLPADIIDEATTISTRMAREDGFAAAFNQVQEWMSHQLSEDERRLMLYRGFEGLPHEDVARLCGLSVGTVRNKWSQLSKRIREAFPWINELMGKEDQQ